MTTTRPGRRLLIVPAVELVDELMIDRAADLFAGLVGEPIETVVVVPLRESPVEWLTNDDDGSRRSADRMAHDIAAAVPGPTVARITGDPDPRIAIEDALRRVGADEVLLISTEEDTSLETIGETVLGVPVTRVDVRHLHTLAGSPARHREG